MGSAFVVNLLCRLPRASSAAIKLELTLLLRVLRGERGEVKVGKGDSSRGDCWERKIKLSGRSGRPVEKAMAEQNADGLVIMVSIMRALIHDEQGVRGLPCTRSISMRSYRGFLPYQGFSLQLSRLRLRLQAVEQRERARPTPGYDTVQLQSSVIQQARGALEKERQTARNEGGEGG